MKYIKQFGIILIISFIGEFLNFLIPLSIPASIYGLLIMLACLHFKVFGLSAVKTTASFLIEIMPLMFIPAAVGLINSWDIIKTNLAAYIIITVVSTILVMGISGVCTQAVIRFTKKSRK